MVYDVDFKTGKIRWERELRTAKPPMLRHVKNSYASETAVTDGERVYVYFGSIGLLAALDLNGKPVWSKELGAFNTQVELGTGASPVLYKDRLYVVNDNTTQSFLAAFDKRTGAEVWRVNREERGNWSTPFVWENDVAHRDRDDGHRQGPLVRSRREAAVGAQGHDDLDHPVAVREERSSLHQFRVSRGPSASGVRHSPRRIRRHLAQAGRNEQPVHRVWYQPLLGTYNTSSLVYGDYYYTLLDRGFLLCHDARTGKQIYGRQRISGDATGFTASPWAYNGKIFVLSEDGDTYVIQAGPAFKVVGKNSLGDMPLATPAVLRSSVIIRTQSKLYRIAKGGRP